MENNKNKNTPDHRNRNVKTQVSQEISNVRTRSATKKDKGNVSTRKPPRTESQTCSLSCFPSTSKSTPKTQQKLTRSKVIIKKKEPKVSEVKVKSIFKTPVKKGSSSVGSSFANKNLANRPKLDTPKRVKFLDTSDPEKKEEHIDEDIDGELPPPIEVNDIDDKILHVLSKEGHKDQEEGDENKAEEINNDLNPFNSGTNTHEGTSELHGTQEPKTSEEENILDQGPELFSKNQPDNYLQNVPVSITQPQENFKLLEPLHIQPNTDSQDRLDADSDRKWQSFMTSFEFSPIKGTNQEEGNENKEEKIKEIENLAKLETTQFPSGSTSSMKSIGKEKSKADNPSYAEVLTHKKRKKSLSLDHLNQPKTPEEHSRQYPRNLNYQSPPVLLRTLSSNMSGNKIAEVLIYQLGSQSTPRKIRKDTLMNCEPKSDWGTPKTNNYPTYNWLSRNMIGKKGINKLNINKRKISEIPSALVKPVNIKSIKPIKDKKNTMMELVKHQPVEPPRKVTREVYSVKPVMSLVKKFENIIAGKSASNAENYKPVRIKIRTGFLENKEQNSSETVSNNTSSQGPIDSQKSISCKRKFSFSDEEEERNLNVDNVLQHQNLDSEKESSQAKFNIKKKFKKTGDVISNEEVKLIEKVTPVVEDEEVKNVSIEFDVPKSGDDLPDLRAKDPLEDSVGKTENHNDNSYHTTSDKSEKTISSFYVSETSASENPLTLDSGFSETGLSDYSRIHEQNSTQFKDSDKNEQIFNNIEVDNEKYFVTEEDCHSPELLKTERNLNVLITDNEEYLNIIEDPDTGHFVMDSQGDDTPTASVSMLFKIAEGLVDSPLTYTDYRREFYKRLSIENSPVGC